MKKVFLISVKEETYNELTAMKAAFQNATPDDKIKITYDTVVRVLLQRRAS